MPASDNLLHASHSAQWSSADSAVHVHGPGIQQELVHSFAALRSSAFGANHLLHILIDSSLVKLRLVYRIQIQ